MELSFHLQFTFQYHQQMRCSLSVCDFNSGFLATVQLNSLELSARKTGLDVYVIIWKCINWFMMPIIRTYRTVHLFSFSFRAWLCVIWMCLCELGIIPSEAIKSNIACFGIWFFLSSSHFLCVFCLLLLRSIDEHRCCFMALHCGAHMKMV